MSMRMTNKFQRSRASACQHLVHSYVGSEQILEFDRMIRTWQRSCETSRRLEIPGVGPALATALVASVVDPRTFRSGPDFSAWTGLVPKQNSSRGKLKLGSISKQGDRYLRGLFTAGAFAVIRYAKIHGTGHRPWLTACCPYKRGYPS
jgi:transposase